MAASSLNGYLVIALAVPSGNSNVDIATDITPTFVLVNSEKH
jgi:hypothetical protein